MIFFPNARRSNVKLRSSEGGYIMLTLLLMVTLIIIGLAAVLPAISYQIKRDQEEEMIHRGVQYSRAIRTYFKKFGRYPARLEDLDNTNNLRYIRKHYKDPTTGKDFKLLRFGDPGVTLAGGIAGGTIPGANAIGANGLNGTGSNSAFGGGAAGSGFGNSGFGNSSVNNSGVFAQSQGSQSSGFGGSSNSNSNSSSAAGQPGTNADSGKDPSQPAAEGKGTPQGDDASSSSSTTGNQPVFGGGGAIVGVASTNKNTGLREFNHKKKYNEWQFFYDPGTDRGGLITTPNQPSIQGFGSAQGLGTNGQPGSPAGSPFGQSPFGQQGGAGQSPFGQQNGPGQPPFGQQNGGGFNSNPNPTPPPGNPQQQQ